MIEQNAASRKGRGVFSFCGSGCRAAMLIPRRYLSARSALRLNRHGPRLTYQNQSIRGDFHA